MDRMIDNSHPSRENHPSFDDSKWKPIAGWSDYYVHPNGYVKSVKIDINPKYYTKTTKELILKMFSIRGYSSVNLVSKGKRSSCRVHRLVAKSFVPNPENKPCVNHKDGVKSNNSVENLEWCTYKENETHSYYVLGKKSPSKPKIMAKDRFEIKKLYFEKKVSTQELSEMFKVSKGTIQRILNKYNKYAEYKN